MFLQMPGEHVVCGSRHYPISRRLAMGSPANPSPSFSCTERRYHLRDGTYLYIHTRARTEAPLPGHRGYHAWFCPNEQPVWLRTTAAANTPAAPTPATSHVAQNNSCQPVVIVISIVVLLLQFIKTLASLNYFVKNVTSIVQKFSKIWKVTLNITTYI